MNYIIHPIWFYLLVAIKNITALMYTIGVLMIFIIAAEIIMLFVCKYGCEEYPNISQIEQLMITKLEKIFKPTVIFTIVLWLLYAFIPSQETMIAMMVSKFATYENAQLTLDAIKNAVNYIIQVIG